MVHADDYLEETEMLEMLLEGVENVLGIASLETAVSQQVWQCLH